MTNERKSLEAAFTGGVERGKALTGVLAPRTPANVPQAAPEAVQPASKVVNVGIYLPVELLKRLTTVRRRQGTTYADLLVDAFDKVPTERLVEYFAIEDAAPTPGQMPRAVRPHTSTSGIQRQFRLTIAQRDFVDQVVSTTGAPSRSALVAAVLGDRFK